VPQETFEDFDLLRKGGPSIPGAVEAYLADIIDPIEQLRRYAGMV
jgi:hypothetical protein